MKTKPNRPVAVKDTLDRSGFVFAIAGTALFSMKAIFIKLAFMHDVHPDVLLMLRMGFALPFFFAIALHSLLRDTPGVAPNLVLSSVLVGLLGYYLANTLDMYGLQYLPASLERVILFTYPAIVVLMSVLFFGYKASPLLLASVAATYSGLLLVFLFGVDDIANAGDNFYLGAALVAASAFVFSFFKIGSSRVMRVLSARQFTAFAMTGASVAIACHFLIRQDASLLLQQTTEVYLYGLVLAIFCTVLPAFLVSEGVRRVGAPIASAVGGIGPVFTLLMAMVVLGERLNWVQLLGFLIVVVSVFSLGRLSSR